jgi:hypothetical protein
MGDIAIPQAGTNLATISTICRKKRGSMRLPTMTEGEINCVVTHQIVKGEA